MSVVMKFVPANGCDYADFYNQFCSQCKYEDYDAERWCKIHSAAMNSDYGDDTNHPIEWTFDKNDRPVCTAFQQNEVVKK